MNNLNNENLTIDTLIEFAKPYRDRLSIKNQKIAQKNKIKAEKRNKRIQMKIQKKTEKLIKMITPMIIKAAKKGFDEYNYFIYFKYLYIEGINYTEDCIEKIKRYYTDKGFSVVIFNYAHTTRWFDNDGYYRSEHYHCITISWKKENK